MICDDDDDDDDFLTQHNRNKGSFFLLTLSELKTQSSSMLQPGLHGPATEAIPRLVDSNTFPIRI